MRPLKNNIFVKLIPEQGDLFLPESKEDPRKGEVISAGPNAQVAKGDVIMFGKWAGVPFSHEGEDYLSMTDMDVLVVLE